MADTPYVSLSLTHVSYNADDHIAHICAFLALVPQALFLTYIVLSWSTREIEVAIMFAGQMACEALNWILKRTIRENRPTCTLLSDPCGRANGQTNGDMMTVMHGKGYGMPSSHAQFVAFFSTYLTLFLLLRHDSHHPFPSSTHTPTPYWQRLALSVFSLAGALAVAQSRIYLTYHSQKQVYVGYAVGVACGVTYFIATGLLRRWGWIDWILDTTLARSLRVRDLVIYEDPVDPGWDRWEQLRRKRSADKSR